MIVSILKKNVLRIKYVISGETSYFFAPALYSFVIEQMETGMTPV